MKKLLGSTLLLALAGTAFAATPDFSGTYNCQGHDPFVNKPYTGTINIDKNGQAYHVVMTFDKGDDLDGVGILSQDGQNLAVAAQETKPTKAPQVSVSVYSLSADGNQLISSWTTVGKNQAVTETCQRSK